MPDTPLQYIGQQIKHYRKARGLTINDLSLKIHKSKGSISKYENGQIALDVSTLYEIANALEIDLRYLIDYQPQALPRPKIAGSPFGGADTLFLYHTRGNAVFKSIIKTHAQAESGRVEVTLFYIVEDPAIPHNCVCIYAGEMYRYDTVLCYTLQNGINPVEKLLLNFVVPTRHVSTLTGLISGLTFNALTPACFLGILSPTPLAETEELRMKLSFSRETLAEAKKKNILSLGTDDAGV